MEFKNARVSLLTMLFAVPLFSFSLAEASPLHVEGEYIEARTCDVWTGPCFANGEINLRGDNAVMGWAVRTGTWKGVRIDGLKVAASIDAEGTLGTNAEGKVRSVLYVDPRASEEQGKALVEMAKTLAPRYLKNVIRVKTDKRISLSRKGQNAQFQVGREVMVRTKALSRKGDAICGNEEKAYPTLAATRSAVCAKTVSHVYRGSDLGLRWNDPGARSAMVGSFSLPEQDLVDASP